MDVLIEFDKDFNKSMRILQGLDGKIHKLLLTATKKAINKVHENVPKYPDPIGAPYPFVSLKQRIFVIASIREGSMQVPYRRRASGGIGGSITTEVEEIGADVIGSIGTNKEYAPWVISSEPVGNIGGQSRYHQGVWYTLQDVMADSKKDIISIYKNELSKLFQL